jgi:hypothetical protein
MEIFAFLPAIIALILTVTALSSIFDKQDEIIWRIWKLIFGVILLILTIYLTNLGLKEKSRSINNRYIYYNNYY